MTDDNKPTELHKIIIGATSHSMEGGDQLAKLTKKLQTYVESIEVSSIYTVQNTFDRARTIHDVKEKPLIDGLAMVYLAIVKWSAEEVDLRFKEIRAELSVEVILLAYEDMAVMTPELTLPHPEFHMRPELLIPAVEVWGDYHHPVLNQSLYDLSSRFSETRWGEFYAQGKSVLDF